ncbi:ribosome biogenesis GTPase YlqF [Rhodocyclus purpureus]|uniref:ribosome biogenesis GTPase YlqF n=1 Tax=Rhodocyclus purpureus TaxID=1067 RepID=UPI001911C82F|nr:ribosome biogenesis GTPase YlqF [Rhodocyclus purpureus]MBK5915598.1 ribosome biogenesis GTPase YlqF [Rhodocyclus purpureus]
MAIQWFPGHMASARKKAAEAMAGVDVVIEVVDARLPEASTNPLVLELRRHRQRPCLKILNKADLADPAATRAWLDHYNAMAGVHAVALSCRKPNEAQRIPTLCQQLAPHRDSLLKPLRMMIMGVPNVGKSTLLNALVKRRIAAVGDEPAITKALTTYDLPQKRTILDTPGLLWPKIEYPDDGLMLAASHSIGRNAFADTEVACFLSGLLLERYPALLTARYGFPVEGVDAVGVIEGIARRRGFRLKGGDADFDKAAFVLLQEYRDGVLGRISLETPQTRAAMIAAAKAREEAEKKEKAEKAARRRARAAGNGEEAADQAAEPIVDERGEEQ